MINLKNLNKLNKESITEPKFTFDFGAIRHAITQTQPSELLAITWECHKSNKVYPYRAKVI